MRSARSDDDKATNRTRKGGKSSPGWLLVVTKTSAGTEGFKAWFVATWSVLKVDLNGPGRADLT